MCISLEDFKRGGLNQVVGFCEKPRIFVWVLGVGPKIFYVGFESGPKNFMQVLEADPGSIGRRPLGPYMWLSLCVHLCINVNP